VLHLVHRLVADAADARWTNWWPNTVARGFLGAVSDDVNFELDEQG
jgi:hypothetical protein